MTGPRWTSLLVATVFGLGGALSTADLSHADWRETWADKLLASISPEEQARINPTVNDVSAPVQDLSVRVTDAVTNRSDAGQQVIDLSADLFFEFGKAEVTGTGRSRIGTEVAKLPQRAKVAVYGHTDNIGDDADNMTLSKNRAQAVADIIKQSRPDLVLDVQGLGETKPVAPNEVSGQDNPENRAKNRRVELRLG